MKTKTKIKKRTKPKKKETLKRDAPKKKHYHKELGAILLFLLSVFIFVSNHYPNTTGLVGHYIVEICLTKLVGSTTKILPLLLLAASLSVLFSDTKKRHATALSILCFLTISLYLETIKSKTLLYTQFKLSHINGGLIGHYGKIAMYKLVGENGTLVTIFGILLIAFTIMFNIPIKGTIIYLIKRYQSKKRTKKDTKTKAEILAEKKKEASSEEPWAKQLLEYLFYEKQKHEHGIMGKIKQQSESGSSKEQRKKSIPFVDITPIKKNRNSPPLDTKPKSEPDRKHEKEKRPLLPIKLIEKKTQKAPEEQLLEDSLGYKFPPLTLLQKPTKSRATKGHEEGFKLNASILEETLKSFNVKAQVVNITPGPSVTRYELKPGIGIKISKITSLSKDIALKLAATDVRIEAPIPGKSLVGIEVPNAYVDTITLRAITDVTQFFKSPSKLECAIGIAITGEAITMDLGKMPHILIAGATGSGKSVCLNTLIISILLKAKPEEVKFLMIDPKKVELSLYDNIPHLLAPVVTNPHKAAATLKQWALVEMENRYENFSRLGVKDIDGYNRFVEKVQKEALEDIEKAKERYPMFIKEMPITHTPDEVEENQENQKYQEKRDPETTFDIPKKIPYIVVIIDELADLMMVASQEVESTICRLAQMARATGIHLVIATQRPSVNVITGLIKANVPSRISFFLQSQIDSRTILDTSGAEKLLGKGDMLYAPVGTSKPQRVQGVYLSEDEIKKVVNHVKKQGKPNYLNEIIDLAPIKDEKKNKSNDSEDELFDEAKNIVISTQYASTSYLQRKLRIGYNRAARLMDELTEKGIISEYNSETKSRTILSETPSS